MKQKASYLYLKLDLSKETTGHRLGLIAPFLELTMTNQGSAPIMVPKPGRPILFSLQVVLTKDRVSTIRMAGGGKRTKIAETPLAPGESMKVKLSPLDDGPVETWIECGIYEAKVRIVSESELASPSTLAKLYGGNCSNTVELSVSSYDQ